MCTLPLISFSDCGDDHQEQSDIFCPICKCYLCLILFFMKRLLLYYYYIVIVVLYYYWIQIILKWHMLIFVFSEALLKYACAGQIFYSFTVGESKTLRIVYGLKVFVVFDRIRSRASCLYRFNHLWTPLQYGVYTFKYSSLQGPNLQY